MSLRIKTHALPAGYTELQYLQSPSSTSTGNYLDTGKPIQQNATYECKFTLGNTQNGSIMGTRTDGWRFWYLVYSGSFEVPAGNDILIPQSAVTPTTGTTYVFKSEHYVSENTFYTTAYIDGVEASTNTVSLTSMPTTNIWLFNNNKDGAGSQYPAGNLKIHYYHIKDTNGNYIQHLIPAKRNSDNKLGMYDIIADTFIATTGADFTAGPEVTTPTKALKEIHELRKSDGQGGVEYIGEIYQKNPALIELPAGYTQLEYIDNDAKAYLNLGMIISSSDVVTFDIKWNSALQNHWFGSANSGMSEYGFHSDNYYGTTISFISANKYSGGASKNIGTRGVLKWNGLGAKPTYDGVEFGNIISESAASDYDSYLCSMNSADHARAVDDLSLYGFKVERNGSVIMNLIPAKNSSDVAGMYNLIDNTFLVSGNENAFIAGPEVPKAAQIFSAGYNRTVSGSTLPLTLPDARAKATTWQIDGQSRQNNLPDGYTQLEYISSDATAALSTGVPAAGDLKIECKFTPHFIDTNFSSPFGVVASNWETNTLSMLLLKNIVSYAAYCDFSTLNGVILQSDTTYTVIFDTYKVYVDGVDVTPSDRQKAIKTFTGDNIAIGGAYYADGNTYEYKLSGDIYYFKLWNNTGTLIRNYVPAKNSEGIVGLYDLINSNFVVSDTGTHFTAGPTLPTPTNPVDVNGCGNSGLPNGYKKLEYIESTGAQYIDTGIKPNGATGMSITYINKTNSDTVQMGMRENAYNTRFWINQTSGVVCVCAIDTSGTNSVTTIYGNKTQIKFNYLNNGKAINNDITSGTTQEITLTGTIPSYTNSIGIFSGPTAGEPKWSASMQCFGAEITEGSEIVFNGIPAQRKSDSVIGMYDTVTNTFFTNAGTDDFIAGPEDTSCVVPVMVSSGLPDGYMQLEYIGTSGSNYTSGEYIDIGIPIHSNSKVEVKANWTNTVTGSAPNPTLFGCRSSSATMNEILLVAGPGIRRQYASITSSHIDSSSLSNISTYLIDANKTYINGELKNTSTSVQFTNTQNMYVGCLNQLGTASRFVKADFYLVKVWQDGVTLVRNMIPAQRISDSVIGMYDTVSKTFFTNQGTGTFTAGPEVGTVYNINLPAPLQKIGTYKDSIESDGTLTRQLRSYVMTGTESFTDQTSGNHRCFFCPPGILNPSGGVSSPDCMSTIGIGDSSGTTANTSFIYGGRFYFVFDNGITFPTLADFTSYLATKYAAGTPVIVYYPLAKPTETTVEVPQLSTNKGTNYISVETQIKPSNMSVTYRKKTK